MNTEQRINQTHRGFEVIDARGMQRTFDTFEAAFEFAAAKITHAARVEQDTNQSWTVTAGRCDNCNAPAEADWSDADAIDEGHNYMACSEVCADEVHYVASLGV